MTDTRPPRADAVRNRRRILDAARQEMTAHGSDAGMDEIARAAGVAVGTLYRHFPTKADLAAAVIAEYVEATAESAEAALARARTTGRAAEEVIAFLREVLDSTASVSAVKATAVALGAQDRGPSSAEVRAAAALDALLVAGKAAGRIVETVGVQDVYLLIETAPLDRSAAVRARWLELVLPGLVTR